MRIRSFMCAAVVTACLLAGAGQAHALGTVCVLDTRPRVLDDEPFLPVHVVDLALWVGEYYACGPGDVLTMAMPRLGKTR